jgi:hypothetical protein
MTHAHDLNRSSRESRRNRLIEASVEIIKTSRCVRSLVFVVPPDIKDDQVKKIARSYLVEDGHGGERTLEESEGVVIGESEPDGIVTTEPVEPSEPYDVVLRADSSGSVFAKRDGSMVEEVFGS